ncbi:GNAT family N-acetyltransferase [Leucobacter sp. NPDC015123]|uniref:GNAT family N-acetyltransferase n=1 Tax=Leucobacter sp. NPDC015123 TaxID=3364129 RepID=UPI0036F491C1
MTTEELDYTIRQAAPGDYDAIIAVVDEWWGRPMTGAVQRLFLDHFFDTSFVAEPANSSNQAPGSVVGFLIGFHSPGQPDTSYIHFVGVHPEARRSGLAGALYERFFASARSAGRSRVRAITSPINSRSVAFHQAVGFTVSEPISAYDGPGNDRVTFEREL